MTTTLHRAALEFIARCVELTGPLSGFLSAPYSAADMEAIRTALGEDELNYLGYSYGAVLGATYAAAHPERVGAFVLDGVTDPCTGGRTAHPTTGSRRSPTTGSTLPSIASPRSATRPSGACSASMRRRVLDDLAVQVRRAADCRTYAGPPDAVDSDRFAELLDESMTYAGDWELARDSARRR